MNNEDDIVYPPITKNISRLQKSSHQINSFKILTHPNKTSRCVVQYRNTSSKLNLTPEILDVKNKKKTPELQSPDIFIGL